MAPLGEGTLRRSVGEARPSPSPGRKTAGRSRGQALVSLVGRRFPLSSFFRWLAAQVERADSVGTFARLAVNDRVCPKTKNRLHLYLLRYEHLPEHRDAIKQA